MRDMFLLKDDGFGPLYARASALATARIIPENLRQSDRPGAEVEIYYVSGHRDFITEADWKRISPLVLTTDTDLWAALELALTEGLELGRKLTEAQQRIHELEERLDAEESAQLMSEDDFELLPRADIGDILPQPADTPPWTQELLKPNADPEVTLVNIVRVERGSFYSKTAGKRCTMWRLFTDDGRQVNAFDHTDPLRDHKPLLIEAGYLSLFMAMSEDDVQTWINTPIRASITPDGQFWKLMSLVKIGDMAAPDFEPGPDTLTLEQQDAAQEAARLLHDPQIVVIDTETTGLNEGVDQPIELAIIDADGNILFHKRIKPTVAVTSGAVAIHHITDEMLANEPTFDDLAAEIIEALEGKRVLSYNVKFDLAMLRNVGVEVEYSSCIADLYNQFAGQKYPSGKLKKHKLTEACARMGISTNDIAEAHTALGDAQRALGLLKAMAKKAVGDTSAEKLV